MTTPKPVSAALSTPNYPAHLSGTALGRELTRSSLPDLYLTRHKLGRVYEVRAYYTHDDAVQGTNSAGVWPARPGNPSPSMREVHMNCLRYRPVWVGEDTPASPSEATTWLWPARVIGKRESSKLREEHNKVVNELVELRKLHRPTCNDPVPIDRDSIRQAHEHLASLSHLLPSADQ